MGIDDLERIELTSRAAWRRWLQKHHATSPGVWLITFKKHVGDKHLPWPDLVREALCFGWIDGRTRRIDEHQQMIFFTRRKPGGIWSAVNKRHIAELEAEGRMTPAGRAVIEAAKADGSWSFLDDIDALIEPEDLAAALDDADARPAWEATPASLKKRVLYDLKTAKTEKTRAKRIAKYVERCARGERPLD